MKRPLPKLPGVRHEWHRVGDVRLHVAEAGDGPPILLLHGFPQHWYVWRRLIPPLAEGHRVLCPDMRGFGWSDAPPGRYDKETLAREALALLDVLGIERCRVAGHDWGGFVGFLMAILAPDRVERLLAMSVFHPFQRLDARYLADAWHTWHGMVLSTPGLGPRALGTSLGDAIHRWLGAGAWTSEEREIFLGQFDEPARARATHSLYRDVRRRDFPRMWSGRYRRLRLTRPTLFLHGRRDRAILPVRRREYAPYADAMEDRAIDAGHALLEERPELIRDVAMRFLGSAA